MADEDELLNPDDIEELLKSESSRAAAGAGSGDSQSGPAGSTIDEDNDDGMLNASMLESAAEQASSSSATETAGETRLSAETEALLEQAEADLATALAPDREAPQPDLSNLTPFQLESFDTQPASSAAPVDLSALQDVELDLRIELGRTELLLDEVMKLAEGSVVPLDKLAGDPVDILVNGKLIARGEVLVLNDNFCVRVAEITAPEI